MQNFIHKAVQSHKGRHASGGGDASQQSLRTLFA
jgi:hypothetical protein